jgi:predicted restriction endonuclease
MVRGNPKGWSGKKHTQEWKDNMSKKLKGRDVSSWIGKSMETRMKRINEGKIRYDGEHARNWQGGKCKENNGLRRTLRYKQWRSDVFQRDNWTCQTCGVRGGILEAHHIKSFSKYPELRFELNNGLTLCRDCHNLTKNFTISK